VHATTAERFEQDYKSIAAILELPGWDDSKTDLLDLVWRWLSDTKSGRWFLILDNADNINVFTSTSDKDSEHRSRPLSGYIPQPVTGSVLLTTRDRRAASWLSTGYTSAITVDLMTPEDAENLLDRKIPDGLSSASEQAELVRELGYLPLAITQAAAYISARATRMTVSKYLTMYRYDEISQSRLLDEESGDLRRDPGVPNSVIRTWQISFDQIKRNWPSAAELLSLMAMLDRQRIPDFLLSVGYPNALDFEAALSPLDEFSLISIEKGGTSFEIHRLVQLATRKWLEKFKEVERWQGKAIEVVSKAFPNGTYRNWEICETLWPHAQEVLKLKFVLDANYLAKAVLLYHMAWYSWLQGRYVLARAQSQESLSIREQSLEGNDIRVFESVGLLGIVLRNQGKYDEAEAMNRRALAGRETALGPEHPYTLASIGNLALVLRDQGKYDEAETMNRRALAGRETALGPEHPDTLTGIGNLALVLWDQGKYDEAETMNRRALAGRETALGPEHFDTLTSMDNLALVLRDQGKYDEAETMNRRALAGKETALGPEHPYTLTSINNLALVLWDQGKYDEAETMNRRALAGRETALGPEHPDTLTSVFCLATLLEALDNFEDATISYQRALSGYNKVLGPKHPTTIACSKRYSSLLEKTSGVIV
jgi:tetratricopeptide (TPR) repeat protein